MRYDSFVREAATIFLMSREHIEKVLAGLEKHGVLKVGTRDGDPGSRIITILSEDVVMDIMQLKKDAD